MRISVRIILIVLFSLAGFAISHAQQFKLTQYGTQQGLPTNSIRSIVQDRIGFIWIASDAGLIRYDGKSFEKFDKGLRSEYIRYICLKEDGNILISSDFGVSEVISRKDTVIIQTLIPGGVLASDSTVLYPNKLFEDSQKRIWVSQPNGVVSLYDKGKLIHFDMGKRNKTGKSTSHFSFVEDEKGTVWIASEPGIIYHYDPKLTHNPMRELVSGRSKQTIHDLKYMGDGKLWVVGQGLQEIILGDRNKALTLNNFRSIGLEISSLVQKANGEIFFGTPNVGLFKAKEQFNEITADLIFIYNEQREVETLPFFEIRDAFVDNKGDIWIASEKGLGLLQSNFFVDIIGVPNYNTNAMTQLPNGDVYVSFGELYRIYQDFGSWQIEAIPTEGGLRTSVASGFDRVWVGNAQGEIFYILDHEVSEKVSLGNSISYMFYDQDGNLWACQESEITSVTGITQIVEVSQNEFETKQYGEEKGVTTRILVAKQRENGYVYFGGIGRDTYLYRYHKKTDSFLNLSVPLKLNDERVFKVQDLAIGENDVVYMATSHGLFKYSSERVSEVDVGLDFSSIEIRAITLNDDGTLWIATDTDGLFQYKEGKTIRFLESSGLPSKTMNYRCLITDTEQRIWAGTAKGISLTQDARPNPKPTPSPIFLELSMNGQGVPRKKTPSSFPNSSNLQSTFISLAYPASGLVYQTRLQASGRAAEYFKDNTWSRASQQSTFNLEQLPEGYYSLEIRAKQRGGYDWSKPLTFSFEVEKVWYRTWWASSLYILVGLLVLWVFIRLNTWRLLRDKDKLESEIHKRTAELIEKNKLLEQQTKEITEQAEDLKIASSEVAEQKEVVEKSYENIKLLTKIGKQIMLSDSLVDAETTITNYLNDILAYSSFAIGVPCTDGSGLELSIFKKGEHSKFFKDFVPYTEQHSLLMWSWKNDKKLIIDDLEKDCQAYIPDLELKRDDMNYSQIYLPLRLFGKSIGIMAVQHSLPNHYDEHHLIIFETLGTYVSVMLSRLYELEEK